LLAVAIALLLAACRPEAPDPVILALGEHVVRRSEFEAHVAALEARGGDKVDPSVLPSLFETYIEERVLVLEARVRGLVRPGASVEDEQKGAQKLLLDEVRKTAEVDQRAVSEYFESHRGEFDVEETVAVRQILVATENQARDVRRRLSKDPRSFESLARASSLGPEASGGGFMGLFARGQLPPELEAAAFALPEGGMSDVVKSSLGYHVLKVDSRTEARKASLEESEGRIRGLLAREASDRMAREFVRALLARAKVNYAAAKLPSPRS
jgi:parvulin-like peptidyl-prolyl isomerase